ncbi:RNA methyltransferase [Limnohabitans sp.]|jgi:tRNA/rRNA methyltransferase|uniref:RNA methyltransferase n=1 Tax=Limnohabitans sp. TaxID=1907725 RepID=UPI00391D128C
MQTRFILIETSHAGNVGAAARAMKVMGFEDLVLVRPRWPNVLRKQEAIQRASGALDVLERARVVDHLDEALQGMTHLCATAMTPRDFGPPTRSPRDHFAHLVTPAPAQQGADMTGASRPRPGSPGPEDWASDATCAQAPSVAFLFGCERFGMKNEDVYRCHVALSIPTAPDFGSLNLAAAIQVIAYEWRMALGGFPIPSALATPGLADAQQVAGMLGHWEQALTEIGFLDPASPKKLMPRLNQLFNRARLQTEEIHILRGVAKAMTEASRRKR